MPKKVIFIGPAYPYKGGIAAFNESLATTFQKNGWSCKMFTFNLQYSFLSKDKLTTEDPRPNLTIERGIYSMNPLNWLKISKQIVKEKPDLLITQYWLPFMAPAFGTILRSVKKENPFVKTLTVVHSFKPDQSGIGDKQLNKYITNRSDLIFCLSQGVRQEILDSGYNGNPIKLFHPVYDHYGEKSSQATAKENLKWDRDLDYLLFFGEIKNYKGLDLLIEALSLQNKESKYKLHIAGEFTEPIKKYQKLIAHHNLEDKVEIRNEYIPSDEVPDLFCGAAAVVTPYKRTAQSGIIPLAIHFEKPVISTDNTELAPLIAKSKVGIICQNNSASLASAINSFLKKDVDLSGDFSDLKEDLSWQSFYVSLMKEVDKDEI